MYIAELVPPRIRGAVVSFNQLMVTLGILVAYIVDWGFAPLPNNWRWMFAVAVVPGAALAIGMYFMPFSPRWLIQKGREDDARGVLERYRFDEDDIDGEIEEIKEVARRRSACASCVGEGLSADDDRRGRARDLPADRRHQHRHLLRADDPQVRRAGATPARSTQSVYIGCTNVFFTIVAILVLDRLGRRFLLIDRHRDADRRAVGLGIFFHRRACSTASAGSRSSACSSTSWASRSASARCSG